MHGFGRTISLCAAGGVAALTVAAAPAASGLERPARALTAKTHVVPTVDRLQPGSIPHASGAAKLDGRLAARDGHVRVVIETRSGDAVRALVARLGGRVERTSTGLVQAAVPARALDRLSRGHGVGLVRAPFMRVEHAVGGEEVAATLAQAWHDKGFTGKGVKVAIIDGGFTGLAERQAEGELPANVSTHDFCRGGFSTVTEHGTAVAEIVHEMAPEAQLYLMCIDTEVDLAAAVEFAKSQGIQIVNHSMGWYGPSRGDGSGYIGDLVAGAKASGILWVNSAGNDAETHWSGTYTPNGDDVHDWASRRRGQLVRVAERVPDLRLPQVGRVAGRRLRLRPRARRLGRRTQLIAMSDAYQDRGRSPLEGVCVRAAPRAHGPDRLPGPIVGYA